MKSRLDPLFGQEIVWNRTPHTAELRQPADDSSPISKMFLPFNQLQLKPIPQSLSFVFDLREFIKLGHHRQKKQLSVQAA